jgi:hemoglobin-like flavoprotein
VETQRQNRSEPDRRARDRIRSLDEIERFSLILILLGLGLVAWELLLDPPGSVSGLVGHSAGDWAPGFVVDGLLLWVVNGILRRHERTRVLNQMGSLSREFALDATRRARQEDWLVDGSLRDHDLSRASLSGAHLAHAVLARSDLRFADFRGAALTGADLSGTDLTGADLTDADLRWADLRGTRLQWADLRGALTDGARLDGADARFAAIDSRQARDPILAAGVVGGFLSDTQIREIRHTFGLLSERGLAPVERFYQRLFEMAPETRHMFRADPSHQSMKFMQTLKVIVSALYEPSKHVSVLQGLGERHGGYGVTASHYGVMADAFLSVFAEELGADFTPEAAAAWSRAFELMSIIMTGGQSAGSQAELSGRARFARPGTETGPVRARSNGRRTRSQQPT